MSTCPICFDDLESKQISSTDVCNHLFCFHCLEKWSKHASYCPVDRKRFKKIIKLHSADVIQVKPRRRKIGIARYDFSARCEICNDSENPATLLLCDSCDLAYHCHCLTPPLAAVPAGLWYCPPCIVVDEKIKKRNGLDKKGETISSVEKCSKSKGSPECSPQNKEKCSEEEQNIIPFECQLPSLEDLHLDESRKNLLSKFGDLTESRLQIDEKRENVDSVLNSSTRSGRGFRGVLNLGFSPVSKSQSENSLTPKSSTQFACKNSKGVMEKLDIQPDNVKLIYKGMWPTSKIASENQENGSMTNCNSGSNIDEIEKSTALHNHIKKQMEKPLHFSIFEKLGNTSTSKRKYAEINSFPTISSSSNSSKLCDICKCWKLKSKKDKLAKSIERKKELLNKKYFVSKKQLLSKTLSKNKDLSMTALINEIRSIQREKWKLEKSFEVKKSRLTRTLIKRFQKTEMESNWNCSATKTSKSSCVCKETDKSSDSNMKKHLKTLSGFRRPQRLSRGNSKSYQILPFGILDRSNIPKIHSSNNVQLPEGWPKEIINSTASDSSSSPFCNNGSSQLPGLFHLNDLKDLVIRRDGSLYLDKPNSESIMS